MERRGGGDGRQFNLDIRLRDEELLWLETDLDPTDGLLKSAAESALKLALRCVTDDDDCLRKKPEFIVDRKYR